MVGKRGIVNGKESKLVMQECLPIRRGNVKEHLGDRRQQEEQQEQEEEQEQMVQGWNISRIIQLTEHIVLCVCVVCAVCRNFTRN